MQKAWNGPELLKMAGLYSVWRGQDGTPVYNYIIYYCVQKAWNGPELLKMAGLYSVWRGQDGTPVYNYTILTRESNSG